MNDTATLHRYEYALREHLRRDGVEQALLHAYELGRELMEAGAGLLDIVRLHTDAVAELEPHHRNIPGWRARADVFLAEVLAPFEMAYLGFKEANSSLRRLTGTLEDHIEHLQLMKHGLTLDTPPVYMAVLSASDPTRPCRSPATRRISPLVTRNRASALRRMPACRRRWSSSWAGR